LKYLWFFTNTFIYIIKGDMFVCLFVSYGRPNGWADRDQTWHMHSCPPRECFWQGQCQGHQCMHAGVTENPGKRRESDTWRTMHKLRPEDGEVTPDLVRPAQRTGPLSSASVRRPPSAPASASASAYWRFSCQAGGRKLNRLERKQTVVSCGAAWCCADGWRISERSSDFHQKSAYRYTVCTDFWHSYNVAIVVNFVKWMPNLSLELNTIRMSFAYFC